MNKKRLISLSCCLLLTGFFSIRVFALNTDDFAIRWDAGNFSFGLIYHPEDSKADLGLHFFNLHFIDEESGFGATICPFVLNAFADKESNTFNTFTTTFLNCELYFDFFHYRETFSIEPVLSFNCFGLENFFNYQLGFGFRLSYYYEPIFFKRMRAEYLSINFGIKIINNKPFAFFDFGLNLMEPILLIANKIFDEIIE